MLKELHKRLEACGKDKVYALVMGENTKKELTKAITDAFYTLFQSGMMADLPDDITITRWATPFGNVRLLVDQGMKGDEIIFVTEAEQQETKNV